MSASVSTANARYLQNNFNVRSEDTDNLVDFFLNKVTFVFPVENNYTYNYTLEFNLYFSSRSRLKCKPKGRGKKKRA